jgi:hypothetical protein
MPSDPDHKTDHRAEAEQLIAETATTSSETVALLALAHSNLAIAEELKGIRKQLEEGAIEVVYGGATV